MSDQKSMSQKSMRTASTETLSNRDSKDLEQGEVQSQKLLSLWGYLMQDIDPKQTTAPLAAYCFMAGYIDCMSFSAIFQWCGLQTGNFAQLALALARLFEGAPSFRDYTFHTDDQQALCSMLAFQVGAAFGRVGDKIGSHKRIWYIFGTFFQALLTMAAALAMWKSGQPSMAGSRDVPIWTNVWAFVALAFMSASVGTQGFMAKKLNTPFGATIVLTTIWIDLATDPNLFYIHKRIPSRDQKLLAGLSLFIGAFVGRAILAQVGTAGALGVAVGFRVLMSFQWVFVPAKENTSS